MLLSFVTITTQNQERQPMARQDQTVDQIVSALRLQQKNLIALQDSLITRARLQEYTEIQFNALAHVAKDGIELVQSLEEGSIVSADWVARRNELVELARRLIQEID
jgi:hypothetical protein